MGFSLGIAAVFPLQILVSLEGTPAQTTWLHLCCHIYSRTYWDILAMLKKGKLLLASAAAAQDDDAWSKKGSQGVKFPM